MENILIAVQSQQHEYVIPGKLRLDKRSCFWCIYREIKRTLLLVVFSNVKEDMMSNLATTNLNI